MNTEIFSKPAALKIDGAGSYSIASVRSAVRFMTTRWPEDAKRGKYKQALHACCDVVEGYGSSELAEQAFKAAAAEAGLLDGESTRRIEFHRLHRAA